MSILRYAWRELAFRRSRSLIAVLSFAIAVLAAVLLTALAASYARAVRAPIETVGADVIVQITGDIPPKLEGWFSRTPTLWSRRPRWRRSALCRA